MAAEGLMALSFSCMDKLKSILISQDFGTEYELLSTELSLQWLRILLWGESMGLDVETPQGIHDSIIDRNDIVPTIQQTIIAVAFLLKDIEDLRCKYQLKQSPTTDQQFKDDNKSYSTNSVSLLEQSLVLRQRMRDNQKQKSFLAIAKWSIYDARRFDDKVKRLRNFIDGLEDISKAAGLCIPQARAANSFLTVQDENPPPYSVTESLPSYPGPRTRRPCLASSPRNAPASRIIPGNSISEPYSTMKRYLAAWPDDSNASRSNARDQILRLSDRQFQDLSTDVYDELLRRQRYDIPSPQWLTYDHSFTLERNEVRRKLSTLLPLRFRELMADTIFEYERRFPRRQDQTVQVSARAASYPGPFVNRRSPVTTRRGCISPHHSPPPLLQHRLAHQSTIINPEARIENPLPPINEDPILTSSFGSLIAQTQEPAVATSHCSASTKIFKSFNVRMSDPTYIVLPAIMRKYNIQTPWEQYALSIAYGTQERRMRIEEMPLIIFKQLDKEGKKPIFMLRKIVPSVSANSAGNGGTRPQPS